MNCNIIERAVSFGLNESLIGIVTEPVHPAENLPRVVALNGGVLHRSGRVRIYVTLSRRLAALGYRVLRFDMSGIGDSLSRGDGLPPTEAAIQDIKDALDWFVGKDGRVVLMGLCDGANLAAHRASIDPRVVGAVLIDPLVPRTVRYRILHLGRRVVAACRETRRGLGPGWRTIKRKTKKWTGQDPGLAQIDPNQPVIREQLEKIYQGLADTGVEVYAIFSGHKLCYREQLLDAFPTIRFSNKLRLEYFKANDHHFEWPPHRVWLLHAVERWLTGLYSAGHPIINSSWGPSGENVVSGEPAEPHCIVQYNSPIQSCASQVVVEIGRSSWDKKWR
jgi:pimeloyl-ACP methyl ester carboxylesterase